ncbi:imidazole glycerol phosphate synthase subunit HisH [Kordiimonas sp. SCSIO 12610]|uniref:imidazole glycerol phosphate synthase subunit HisH n=1 Tax=Kordiimonas sp. SCSIO 12610 TaxID=2829597 RepID=UPI00210EB744|nr:imidazole glycerol phosphate synthase subunit HisH [Kordiimonas sp. SCSIO 12610]UTW55432.1 imidazole glycerol phosphate synthase subunit HisH [Kordiimonas sp. SCSIO 12610]
MSETVAIIDYGSGNLRSAEKSLARAASDNNIAANIIVTNDPEVVLKADRVVLPGVGAFADCRRGLYNLPGMVDALSEQIIERGKPFLGVCVGMQLMANEGQEFGTHPGLGWIDGAVKPIEPKIDTLKIPHMGWNEVYVSETAKTHPVASVLAHGDHAYFVHSYHMAMNDDTMLYATTEYGETLTAIIGRDNMIGTQFHPEKSQAVGLKFLKAFLEWKP